MKRIIWHWTAGSHTPNSVDLRAYHEVIDGSGKVHKGNSPISSNASPLKPDYARHTARLNSDSIGISLASMAGSRQSPFNPGRFPVTEAQVEALAQRTAELCQEYSIPVTRQTVLSHAEVPLTLGIAQPGKWDIMWIPGLDKPRNPVEVGDMLRARVVAKMSRPSATLKPPVNLFSSIRRFLTGSKNAGK